MNTRISSITIARLFNLGNYEHVRYEFRLELAEDAKPGDVFSEFTALVGKLGPGNHYSDDEILVATETVSMPFEKLIEEAKAWRNDDEIAEDIAKQKLQRAQKLLADKAEEDLRRQTVLDKLNKLGARE